MLTLDEKKDMFKEDLVKEFLFNSPTEELFKLREFINTAKNNYIDYKANGLQISNHSPIYYYITPDDFLKDGNLEERLPKFIINNFSGMILDTNHNYPVYLNLIKKNLPILVLRLSFLIKSQFGAVLPLSRPCISMFVIDKNNAYGYHDVLSYCYNPKLGPHILYAEVEIKGREDWCKDIKQLAKKRKVIEFPESAYEVLDPFQYVTLLLSDSYISDEEKDAIDAVFTQDMSTISYALFKDRQEILYKYKGFLNLGPGELLGIFNTEDLRRSMEGGILEKHSALSYVKPKDGQLPYSNLVCSDLLNKIKASTIYKIKCGPEIVIDKNTKVLLEKRFFIGLGESLFGSECIWTKEGELKREHYHGVPPGVWCTKDSFNTIATLTSLTNIINEVEIAQENLYNKVKGELK